MPLQLEEPERDHAGDEPGGQERNAEEEIEAERRTDELRDVGRHRHRLGLDPEAPRDRAGVVVAAQLRQVAVGDHPELRGEVLDQHRHQVRGEHDPEQEVAEAGAALDVRCEVARVDVRDGGDEGGPEHRERRPYAAAGDDRVGSGVAPCRKAS